MSEKRKRGRPLGSGKKDDAAVLRAMARLMVQEPGLKKTRAIKRVVTNWDETSVRRLQRAWQKDGAIYFSEAEAEKARADEAAVSRRSTAGTGYSSATDAVRGHSVGGLSDLYNSPIMQAARDLQNSGIMQAARELQNSGILQAARELQNSGVMRAARELQESAAFKAARDFERLRVNELQFNAAAQIARDLGLGRRW